MRLRWTWVAVVCCVACLGAGASALAASSSTPKGGPIGLIVQPGDSQGAGKIIFTGAIGDYGTSSPTKTKDGHKYGVAALSKGTLHVDLTAITKKVNSANPPFDSATCSAEISETAPAGISDGTGAYKGVSGSVNLTETFAIVVPRYTSGKHKGQCNASPSATPAAQIGTVYGTGSVTF